MRHQVNDRLTDREKETCSNYTGHYFTFYLIFSLALFRSSFLLLLLLLLRRPSISIWPSIFFVFTTGYTVATTDDLFQTGLVGCFEARV